ncbi:MAG: hypothetical protein ACLT2F_01960 [Butyricicoccus sp.]
MKPEEVSSTAAKTDPRQARERLVKRMEREAKKTPAPEGENWLEQYTCLVLTGKITACRKVRTLCRPARQVAPPGEVPAVGVR